MIEKPAESGTLASPCSSHDRRGLAARDIGQHVGGRVMGGHGGPRLVETIVGGVTRELFVNPPLPIFTCH